MSTTNTASERITDEVTAWPGVTAGIGERGEYGFTVDGHQIGHLHGDRVAHSASRATSASGSVTRAGSAPIRSTATLPRWLRARWSTDEDVTDAIALMRLNYDRVTADHPRSARPQ